MTKLGIIKKFTITSGFNSVDSVHKSPHSGIDLAMPEGTGILSPACGVIEKIFNYGSANAGKGLVIKVQDGSKLIFGHMSDINVKVGNVISVGDKLGDSGNTGFSTAPHLHIGLKDVNGNLIDPSTYENIFQNLYALHQSTAENTMQFYDTITNIIQSFIQ